MSSSGSSMSGGGGSGSQQDFVGRMKTFGANAAGLLRERDWIRTLRGPRVFAGVGDDGTLNGWSSPSGSDARMRLQKNFGFFISNYLLICAILTSYCILTDLALLFWVVLVGGAWFYALRVHKFAVIDLGSVTVNSNHQYFGLVFLTSILLVFFVGPSFLWVLTVTSILAAAHAVFRTPSYDDKTFDSGGVSHGEDNI